MGRSNLAGPLHSVGGFESPETSIFRDDFVGASTVIPAVGAAESGVPWVKGITGAAPPTVAGVQDIHGGVVDHTLTSASQAQEASLLFGDNRSYSIAKGFIFTAIVKMEVLPTLLAKFFIGMGFDRNADPDAVTHSVWIAVNAGGNVLAELDDSVADQSIDSGVDVIVGDTLAVRIDARNSKNVLFYIAKNPVSGKRIEWRRIARTTVFSWDHATVLLQPYIAAAKASGAGVGTLRTDYVEIITTR